jgi:hypothetical protein
MVNMGSKRLRHLHIELLILFQSIKNRSISRFKLFMWNNTKGINLRVRVAYLRSGAGGVATGGAGVTGGVTGGRLLVLL